MARRGVSIHDRDRWVFNRLAEAYRARPGYPAALVARLATLAGGTGRRVADLGAGTGAMALPLARAGLTVHAVEPAEAMLLALRAVADPAIVTVHAAAEETGLPSAVFDLVVVADALQWIDVERGAKEAARLVAPGGIVAVVDPRPAATPFMAALGELIAAANPKARPRPLPLEAFFTLAVGARPVRESFVDTTPLDDERLQGILCSISLVGPALGPARLTSLLADAQALARAHDGAAWAREIALTWAARPAAL